MLDQLQTVFASLQSLKVKYLVIGGIAAVLYGVPRATFDLDLLIEASAGNARHLLDAFLEAGLGTASLTTPEELISHEITIFRDRVRIDVQTKTPGLVFSDAWKRREKMEYRGQVFWVISKGDLITSKLAAGRKIDQEDVNLLLVDDQD
ncbi:MAG: hypothetical protein A2032_05735 [Chloroflexi bacterium RBG_19FT_COMBO_49_13]|nr:MAG: hypothetical protein A2032_05735 [Chloroflexi bacterium RBG_19FT_COMBO_49_13]